jgi:predicted nucleotidyltransferase
MKTVDPKTERAVRTFLERISRRYPVIAARLFGSRSRRDQDIYSDADLAVVLRGPRGDAVDVGVDMAGVAFDVLMDTEILVSPLPIWEDEWAHRKSTPTHGFWRTSGETESFFEGSRRQAGAACACSGQP